LDEPPRLKTGLGEQIGSHDIALPAPLDARRRRRSFVSIRLVAREARLDPAPSHLSELDYRGLEMRFSSVEFHERGDSHPPSRSELSIRESSLHDLRAFSPARSKYIIQQGTLRLVSQVAQCF
jgi:hypothetical protein